MYQADTDFNVEFLNDPVATKGEPIVKYCEEQIQELLHIGEFNADAVLGASRFTEQGADYLKETRATYLFEGQWVSEERVQRYVPSGQFKVELLKSASFKAVKRVTWSPDQN